jgi:hypothetical protein
MLYWMFLESRWVWTSQLANAHIKFPTPMPSASGLTYTFKFLHGMECDKRHDGNAKDKRRNTSPLPQSQQLTEGTIGQCHRSRQMVVLQRLDINSSHGTRKSDRTITQADWWLKACVRVLLQWPSLIRWSYRKSEGLRPKAP